jgi:mannose-6-phosphate isomerase-like protein (cupin superfamily)
MVEKILHQGKIIAIIVPADFRKEGLEFFTPDEFSQQLAYMKHPAGHKIVPHTHNKITRSVQNTLETLFIRSGKVRIDFYSDEREYIGNRTLGSGDVVLLVSGGHGFTMVEPTEMIEVKQGPYSGDKDKVRFDGGGNG